MRSFLPTGILLLYAFAASTFAADTPQLDLEALARTGAATSARLRTSAASWTVDNSLGSGAVIGVSVMHAGDKGDKTGSWRMTFGMVNGAARTQLLRIISRDGLWYATEKAGASKYRPYELPTDTPFIYFCMQRSTPVFVTPDRPLGGATLESVDDHIATFRQPIDADLTRLMRGLIDNMGALERQSGKPLGPALVAQLAQLKDFLANGLTVRVDVSTGQIVEFGSPQFRTRFSGFKFLAAVDSAEFAVDDRQWEDNSNDPTSGILDDLIMIAHCPMAKVGDKNYELDGRLMDVKTGRFRRIPFEGGVVMPGCFLPGRRSVIVGGMTGASAAIRPYEIDLKTGINRALGGKLLEQGFTLMMDVSPDGKTLVVLHSDPAALPLLSGQIFLIDLKTAEARPIGKPMDTAFLNWTADGEHIVLLDRKSADPRVPSVTSLAIMDLKGNVTVLRPGNFPVLLADRKTILFEDSGTRLWHTCDLTGQADQLFGNGLKGYGFPAPAPDGQRILMMKFEAGQLPKPTVVPIGQSEGQVITSVPGVWGLPAWR